MPPLRVGGADGPLRAACAGGQGTAGIPKRRQAGGRRSSGPADRRSAGLRAGKNKAAGRQAALGLSGLHRQRVVRARAARRAYGVRLQYAPCAHNARLLCTYHIAHDLRCTCDALLQCTPFTRDTRPGYAPRACGSRPSYAPWHPPGSSAQPSVSSGSAAHTSREGRRRGTRSSAMSWSPLVPNIGGPYRSPMVPYIGDQPLHAGGPSYVPNTRGTAPRPRRPSAPSPPAIHGRPTRPAVQTDDDSDADEGEDEHEHEHGRGHDIISYKLMMSMRMMRRRMLL